MAVHFLQNISVRRVGFHQVGFIDMPVAVAFAADRRAFKLKLGNNLFHGVFFPPISVPKEILFSFGKNHPFSSVIITESSRFVILF